jgi:predicted NAD/FAD-binding protein
MRIAIIGTGISGMTSGYLLSDDHEITAYEADRTIGGHTATFDVPGGAVPGRWTPVSSFLIIRPIRTSPG